MSARKLGGNAYWQIGSGAAALLWAAWGRRGRVFRWVAAAYGVSSIVRGLIEYEPVRDAVDKVTHRQTGADQPTSSWREEWDDDESYGSAEVDEDELEDGAEHHTDGKPETILRLGSLRLQRIPRQNSSPTLWGVVRHGEGNGYGAPAPPEDVE